MADTDELQGQQDDATDEELAAQAAAAESAAAGLEGEDENALPEGYDAARLEKLGYVPKSKLDDAEKRVQDTQRGFHQTREDLATRLSRLEGRGLPQGSEQAQSVDKLFETWQTTGAPEDYRAYELASRAELRQSLLDEIQAERGLSDRAQRFRQLLGDPLNSDIDPYVLQESFAETGGMILPEEQIFLFRARKAGGIDKYVQSVVQGGIAQSRKPAPGAATAPAGSGARPIAGARAGIMGMTYDEWAAKQRTGG